MARIPVPDASVKIALHDGRINPVWLQAISELSAAVAQLATALQELSAASVAYDNTTSGLTATDVQAALDEIEARVEVLE